MKNCLCVIFCVLFLSASGEQLRIGLFPSKKITSINFKSNGQAYKATGHGFSNLIGSWTGVVLRNGKLHINGRDVGANVRFRTVQASNSFNINSKSAGIVLHTFAGDLVISVLNGEMVLINEIDIEEYLSGVVESESGKNENLEYYKTQAIISRTYTLCNMNKHHNEGFNLCNEVHCQAYNGVSRHSTLIPKAVKETESVVIVDSDIELIHATYHSNCGGQTVNSEEVWTKSESYLRSVVDTFCLQAPHAQWEHTMDTQLWQAYLENDHGLGSKEAAQLLNFYPKQRLAFLQMENKDIATRDIRENLDLRSTYFKINTSGKQTQFIGRGFGHGVGLCQEGAMEMSKRGYTSFDILHHYYKNIHLVHLSYINFFKEDQ